MTTKTTSSSSADEALRHLKALKPLDGWAVEKNSAKGGYRLLRRNVPLTDNYFLDIHYEAPGISAVVGILTKNRDGRAQAQVLVDRHGRAVGRKIALVTVSTWGQKTSASSRSSTPRSATATAATGGGGGFNTGIQLTDEQNKQLLQYAGATIFGMVMMRVLFSTMAVVWILALPLGYLYLVQNLPSNTSFDAKKELKRVMRGQHLPDDHPDKPKGFLSEALARLNASVTTELATGLGYEVTFYNIAQAATVVCVRVPSGNMDFYWVGAAKKWYYVYANQLESSSNRND